MGANKLAELLRKVVDAAANQPWSTSWEDAFQHLAKALDHEQPQPTPQPAPDVVREALEAVNQYWRDERTVFDKGAKGKEAAWQNALDALAALDAAPAEEVLGYAVLGKHKDVMATWPAHKRADALAYRRNVSPECSLVRLVAEKEPKP